MPDFQTILDYGVSVCLIAMFLGLIHGVFFKFPRYVKEDALPKLIKVFTDFQQTLEANTHIMKSTVALQEKHSDVVADTNNQIGHIKQHLKAHEAGSNDKYEDVFDSIDKIMDALSVIKSEHQTHAEEAKHVNQVHRAETERIIQREMASIQAKMSEINAVLTMYANQLKQVP